MYICVCLFVCLYVYVYVYVYVYAKVHIHNGLSPRTCTDISEYEQLVVNPLNRLALGCIKAESESLQTSAEARLLGGLLVPGCHVEDMYRAGGLLHIRGIARIGVLRLMGLGFGLWAAGLQR